MSEQQRMVDTARRERFGFNYWRARDVVHEFAGEFWKPVCEPAFVGSRSRRGTGSGLGMVEIALLIEELAASGGGSTLDRSS